MRRATSHNPELARILASPSWARCEERIKAFEEAWVRGDAPAVDDYLDGEGTLRHALLVELVHADLEFRLKASEAARVETYLVRYPEVAGDRAAVLELLAAEYGLRRRYEGDVGPAEFGLRFPEFLDDLFDRILNEEEAGRWPTAVPGGPASADTGRGTDPEAERPAVPGYEVQSELGRGGMGVVYKARDLVLGRPVALKLLPAEYTRDPDRLDRFLREARTASSLNHPHICTIHALGEHEGRPFIVMELIDGQTLHQLGARRLGAAELARLFGQAAGALAAAHAAGVVHRDVKPENVMVRADGYVKVLDFGLARRLPALASVAPGAVRQTAPGAFVGTVAYMSPEQARGELADSASDVFALGIVLYELATGQHPFEADGPFAMLQAIVSRRPVPPARLNPELPVNLAGLIESMLQKDARLRPTAAEVEAALGARGAGPVQGTVPAAAPRSSVGRGTERGALRAAFAEADAGRGTMLCIAGEPGIGKTTLVEDFLGELAARPGCLVARGHCSERLAAAEAYLPVFEALEELLRGAGGDAVARLMRVVAPAWYAQVAPPAAGAPAAACCETAPATSQQALKREFCNFLREVARLGPLVLFFDDVHWADVSTVDLLAHLGRHWEGLRVLVVLTYRPTELLLGPHPFHGVKLELQGRGACREVPLGFLSRDDIDSYLALAFPNHAFPADFAGLVHLRTEGSPLFFTDLLSYLRERGVIAEDGGRWVLAREPDVGQELPETARSMIQRKLEQLGEDDRRLLAAASVQGSEFDSAVVAGALGLDAAGVEERLQLLERVHGLVRLVREDEFPDRTLTLRYRFVHVLYQHALYAGLPPTRRAALSAALARALEAHHGEESSAVAAELGCLYESGREFGRAARAFWLAAQNAARVFAHHEAVVLARRGLRLLGALPETPERAELELPLQVALGLQLQVTEGFAATEAGRAYARARALCLEVEDPALRFPVLWGLWLFHKVSSELAKAREMAGELLELARGMGEPALALQAQQALAVTTLCRGEPALTLRHMEQGAALYDPNRHRSHSFQFGQDPGVACKAFGSVALWLLGHPDEAVRQSDAAVGLSRELGQPFSEALALYFGAMLHQCRRDPRRVLECAEASGAIALEHGFSFWLAGSAVLRGWALAACGAEDEGDELLRQGLRDWLGTGSLTYHTYFLGLLADVLLRRGGADEGWRALEEALALARKTGEGLYEAELHRLRGELLLCRPGEPAPAALRRAEEEFRRALDVARRQEATSLELRAAMSLLRLARRLGRGAEARPLLAGAYDRFTEGFGTPDLEDARSLLDAPA